MQENIIGYLLGALDDDEMAEFEAELERNDGLQLLVQDAARSLQVFGDSSEEILPPTGLLQATCQRIRDCEPTKPAANWNPVNRREFAQDSESWSLFDVIVAASVLFVGCMLFLPAIQGSRIHAQVAGCQDNLRNIGCALIAYSEYDQNHAFPRIPIDRKLGIAGIYGPLLLEAGFLTEDHNFFCPSLLRQDLCMDEMTRRIPRVAEIARAHGPELERLQENSGGTYGFILGYLRNGILQPARNGGRDNFPICSDQPICEAQPTHRPLSHCNLLFESGGVRLFPWNMQEWNNERLFEDAYGRVQAGVDEHDIVIAASSTPPIPWCD